MLGFASCDTDREPVLTIPEPGSFVLNEPVFADQELVLNPEQTFELVASQPDYGFAASCVYGAEVSLTDDFKDCVAIKPVDAGLARMTFHDSDLAKALCNLHGFNAAYYEDLPAGEVFFRATVEIPGVEGTAMTSNVVSMKLVKFYHAVQGRRDIYLVGNVSGWTTPDEAASAHYDNWKLTETEIGSDVYKGSFTFPAGAVEFRFYTELSGWGSDGQLPSVGANPDDGNAKDINGDFIDNVYTGPCCPGKGSWKFTMDAENNVNITVDLANMTVKFEVGGEADWSIYPCIYLVGNPNGWKDPEEGNADILAEWRLYDTTGAGIYVTKDPFTFPAGENYFRFYQELTGWGNDGELPSMGALPNDGTNVQCEFADGVFNGTWVPGKGSWVIKVDAPTKFTMEVNSVDGTVRFTEVSE